AGPARVPTLAVERDYVRPQVDRSLAFAISGGRHPVVEQMLVKDGGPFVANDCDLSPPQSEETGGSAGRIWIVTGPNMAGISTFLRQNALIAILAQIASFLSASAPPPAFRLPLSCPHPTAASTPPAHSTLS